MAFKNLSGGRAQIEFVDETRQTIRVSGEGADSAHQFLSKFATEAAQLSPLTDHSFSYQPDGLLADAIARDDEVAADKPEQLAHMREKYVTALNETAMKLDTHITPQYTGNFIPSNKGDRERGKYHQSSYNADPSKIGRR